MRLFDRAATFALWLGLAAGLLMMLHVTIDVSARTFLNRPIAGTTEIVAAYYMVAVAYLPWAWAARRDQHISVDLVTRLLPAGVNRVLDVIVKLLTSAYLGLFAWQGIVSAIRQTSAGEVWEIPRGFLPVWPARWILPVAAVLMLAAVLLSLIGVARKIEPTPAGDA
jgi:TRAP-type C4-dicarboxylate transport system permease small subunit